ncbi:MAG: aldo/keto reductase [Longimicrobiaceae bacterium]
MKYRTYPNSDVTVSEVGFGTWTVSAGWWGSFSDDQAIRLLRAARDLGVTLFDAADSYGNGRAEELVGRAFRDNRHQVVLATKVGYDFYAHPERKRGQREIPQNADPAYLRSAVEKSLERFGSDVIDIVAFHNAKLKQVEDDAVWETFERLKEEGKVRHWGAALGPSNGYLYEGLDLIRRRRAGSLQLINNILEPFPGQHLTESAGETGDTGVMVRVTHSSGMLEGCYSEDTTFDQNDHRRHRPRSWLLNGLKKVETLGFLHQGRDLTLGQASLKWLLASPAVMTTLPNIYDQAQLEEFAAAPDKPDLSGDDLARIDALQGENFGVYEEHMKYKGTMHREGEQPVTPCYSP